MKVLFAIRDDSDVVDSLVRKYKRDNNENMLYKTAKNFTAIMKELQENNDYDRIVINDNVDEKVNNSENKEAILLKKLKGLLSVAVRKNGKSIPIICIVKNKKVLSAISELKLNNCVIAKDAGKKYIYELIMKPRTISQAKEYYKGVLGAGEKIKSSSNTKSEKNEKNPQIDKCVKYLNRSDITPEKCVYKFETACTMFKEGEILEVIEGLTSQTKKVLKNGSMKYNKLMDKMAESGSKAVATNTEPEEKKRGRGRPRKNAVVETAVAATVGTAAGVAMAEAKRGRGRPRKNPVIDEVKAVEEKIQNVAKSEKDKISEKAEKVKENAKQIKNTVNDTDKNVVTPKDDNKKKKEESILDDEWDLEDEIDVSTGNDDFDFEDVNSADVPVQEDDDEFEFDDIDMEDNNDEIDDDSDDLEEDDDDFEFDDLEDEDSSDEVENDSDDFEEDDDEFDFDDLEEEDSNDEEDDNTDSLDEDEEEFDFDNDIDDDDETTSDDAIEDEIDLDDDLDNDDFDLDDLDEIEDVEEQSTEKNTQEENDEDVEEIDLANVEEDDDDFDFNDDDIVDLDESDFEDLDDVDDDDISSNEEDDEDIAIEDEDDESQLEDDDNIEYDEDDEDFDVDDEDFSDMDDSELDALIADDEDSETEEDDDDDLNLIDDEEDDEYDDNDIMNLDDEEEEDSDDDIMNLDDEEEEDSDDDIINLDDEEEEDSDDDIMNLDDEEAEDSDDDIMNLDDEEEEDSDDDIMNLDDEEEEDSNDEIMNLDDDDDDDSDDDIMNLDDEEEEDSDDDILSLDDEEEEDSDDDILSLDDDADVADNEDDLINLEDDNDEDEIMELDDDSEENEDEESEDEIDENDEEEDDDFLDLDDDEDNENIVDDEEDDFLLKSEDDLKINDKSVAGTAAFSGIANKNYNPNYDISKQLNEINDDDDDVAEVNDKPRSIQSTGMIKVSEGQRIVSFVGARNSGTSFIVNNLAQMLSEQGVKTAIVDLTKNKNSYYIYTENEETLRNVAYSCFEKLKSGIDDGIKVNKNLTVYTALPNSDTEIEDIESTMETLLKNYSLVLFDCDFDTDPEFFNISQGIYFVQTFDILTIQALTSFIKKLKMNKVDYENKMNIIVNKYVNIGTINERTIIAAMSVYNSPDTTYQLDLFDRTKVEYFIVPFEEKNYCKYLEEVVKCKLSIRGYSKSLLNNLNKIAKSVYPINGKKSKA